jgi:hypothetical protein
MIAYYDDNAIVKRTNCITIYGGATFFIGRGSVALPP